MTEVASSLIPLESTIDMAVAAIEASPAKVALVVDTKGCLVGTVTDGDVRRGLLRGLRLDAPITEAMNSHPSFALATTPRTDLLALMRARHLRQIPLVDPDGRVVGLETLSELLEPGARPNAVVIMAGGLGQRLRPLTDDRPKALVKVGPKPILETVIENLVAEGFRRFFVSVGYMAAMLEEHFGDGSRWDAEITYLREDSPLGTAGSLGLLPSRERAPLVVMNADLLTRLSFASLLDFHTAAAAAATVAVRDYEVTVPYGVVEIEDQRVTRMAEKPTHRHVVSAGIYVLEPALLDLLHAGETVDMPELIGRVLDKGQEIRAFPVREYWMDIGRPDDLTQAINEYDERFGQP